VWYLWYMPKRTSLYLTDADQARLEASGHGLPEIIRKGLDACESRLVDVGDGRVVVSGPQQAASRWEMSYWRMSSDDSVIIETRLVEADSMEAAVERFRSENPDCHIQSAAAYGVAATWILARP
jgi:hypothetical protein